MRASGSTASPTRNVGETSLKQAINLIRRSQVKIPLWRKEEEELSLGNYKLIRDDGHMLIPSVYLFFSPGAQ